MHTLVPMFKISDWFKLILCTVLSSGVATAGNFGQMNFAYWQTIVVVPTVSGSYLVVGGGGAGGGYTGGGGGAGGLLSGTVSLTLGTTYTVTVGTGGTAVTSASLTTGGNGGDSIISGTGLTTITATGGGGGGGTTANNGGSGGGAAAAGTQTAGTGISGQGYGGGVGTGQGNGGGGAGAAGGNSPSGSGPGSGGVGLTSSITGSSLYYAGGGGGGSTGYGGGAGGNGGGGTGGRDAATATSGTNGLGGGGGGAWLGTSGAGGSGVVIVSLPSGFAATTTGTVTVTTNGTNTVYTFTGSGTFTPVSSIVTTNLILYLDAGKSASYSGSGSTWYDLSTTGMNGTLVNSPTYSTSNGGILSFNGTNQYVGSFVNTSVLPTSGPYTYEIWFNSTNLSARNGFIAYGSYSGTNSTNAFRNDNTEILNYWFANDLTSSGASLTANNWFQAVVTFDGTTRKLYVNGRFLNSDTPGSNNATNKTLTVGVTNTTEYLVGSLGIVRMYSSALTQSDIYQNFTLSRSRFGL